MRIRCGVKIGHSDFLFLLVPPFCGVMYFDSEGHIWLGFLLWDELVASPETVRIGVKHGLFLNECIIHKNENHTGILSFFVTKNTAIESILASRGYKIDML
jgi:hypothetical protein